MARSIFVTPWQPMSGLRQRYAPRGEERRKFIDGDAYGEIQVVHRSGGWMSVVKVAGEVVYMTRGFGFTSKRAAMKDARERVMWWLEAQP